jgi:hypothetical protein
LSRLSIARDEHRLQSTQNKKRARAPSIPKEIAFADKVTKKSIDKRRLHWLSCRDVVVDSFISLGKASSFGDLERYKKKAKKYELFSPYNGS